MSDDQPRPRFGEYAPGYTSGHEAPADRSDAAVPPPPPASPPPWNASPQPLAAVKPRSTVDTVFTVILLVLGLIGSLVGVLFGVALSDPALLDQALKQQGMSFHGHPGAAPAVLIVSHIVLFVAALGLSILAIVRRRIAFWIPLAAGVIATFFFWGSYIAVIASDPTFIQQVQQQQR